jgi:soluble lytic murein transglycosylase-like protein
MAAGRRRRASGGFGAWALGVASCVLLQADLAAAGNIFTYIDQNGVTHFSNVPVDKRYARMSFKSPYPSYAPAIRRAPSYRGYDGLILLNARANDVPPALVKAVIAAESMFDSEAVSHAGAQGLMQLMPDTARSLGVEDPFRPDENVRGGTEYLRAMLDRYGDFSRALAAYNAGPSAVDRHDGVPPYRETRDYVKRVLTYYRHYDSDFGR